MYQKRTVYQTKDDETHATEKQAARHVENIICGAFLDICKSIPGPLTLADRQTLAATLYENREKLRAALDFETYGDKEPKP